MERTLESRAPETVDLDALRAETRRLLDTGDNAEKLGELLMRVAARSEPRDFQLLDDVLGRESTSDELKDRLTAAIVEMGFPRALLVDPDALERYRRRTRSPAPVVSFSLLAIALFVDATFASVILGRAGALCFVPWALGAGLATFASPETFWRRLGGSALRILSAVHVLASFGLVLAENRWLFMHGDDLLQLGFVPLIVTPILGFVLASRSATLGKALPGRTR